MAKVYTGREGRLLLGGTTLVKVTSWQLQADLELLETTTIGDARRTFTPGVLSCSGSASLLYYKENDNNIAVSPLLKKLINTNSAGATESDAVTLTLRLADGSDLNDVTLTAYITSAQFGASVGEIVAAQISFQGTGNLTTVTI